MQTNVILIPLDDVLKEGRVEVNGVPAVGLLLHSLHDETGFFLKPVWPRPDVPQLLLQCLYMICVQPHKLKITHRMKQT